MLSSKQELNRMRKNKLENVIFYMQKKRAFNKCKSEMLNFRRKASAFNILVTNWEKVQRRQRKQLLNKIHARFRGLGKEMPFAIILWIHDPQ